MTNKLFFCTVSFLIFPLLFVSPGHSQIEFRLGKDKLVIAPVSINGTAIVDLLLDTGSTSTLISPELANELGIEPTFRTKIITPAGARFVPGGYLDTVSLGLHSVEKVEVLILDIHAVREVDTNISGVLGENFLAQFNYLLDFEKRRITVESASEVERRARGRHIVIEKNNEKRLLISVPTRGRRVRFALDSGTTELVIFSDNPSALGFDPSSLPSSVLSTVSGNSAVKLVLLRTLRVGDETFYDLPAAVTSRDPDRAEDALMPLSLFRSVYVNHKKGFVVFNPKF